MRSTEKEHLDGGEDATRAEQCWSKISEFMTNTLMHKCISKGIWFRRRWC